jgi:hypothetical protein
MLNELSRKIICSVASFSFFLRENTTKRRQSRTTMKRFSVPEILIKSRKSLKTTEKVNKLNLNKPFALYFIPKLCKLLVIIFTIMFI